MKRWALVIGGVVMTVVEQQAMPAVLGTWVDVTGLHVGPGFLYDGGNFSAPLSPRSLTPREFWRRFTVAERESLQNKLATGTQPVKNKINAFRDYIAIGGNVELDDDYIVASIAALEAAGVIDPGRAAEILA